MSIDDPFAEPGDAERTIIRPNPGGRLAQPVAPAAPQYQSPPDLAGATDGRLWDAIKLKNLNPIVNAAVPLLGLAVRLKNRAVHPNVDGLRQRVIEEINAFERRITPLGLAPQTIRAAKYAICALMDDLVLNTPWGSRSVWSTRSMVGTFFSETWGGDRFFDLLGQLKKDAAVNLDMLELLYFAISLGFEGKYRVMPRGASELALVREDLYRAIRNNRGEFERALSLHWQGVQAAYKGLISAVPIWVILAAAASVLLLCFIGYSYFLADRSDAVFARLAALPPNGTVSLARAAVPMPPPPDTGQSQKIRKFLEPEIKEGLVTVLEDNQSITIRIRAQGMFPSGSADVVDKVKPTLLRIGDALNTEPGPVSIAGHSDNVPIRTLRFPSNYELSLARAKAVQALVGSKMSEPGRLASEGKADTQPIAPNNTPEGREQNRRIEISLTKTT
ncbi:MAG TPA: type IVB secretion system protein IcmH/DotU [Aliidongia sp.]|nr:type IVB secretion system protein IcmH/DotU [Aliidongia sp.]